MEQKIFFVKCWLKLIDNKLVFCFLTKPNDNAGFEFKAVTLQTKKYVENILVTEKEWAERNGRKYQIRVDYGIESSYIILEDTSVEIVLSYELFDKLELV